MEHKGSEDPGHCSLGKGPAPAIPLSHQKLQHIGLVLHCFKLSSIDKSKKQALINRVKVQFLVSILLTLQKNLIASKLFPQVSAELNF